MLALSRLGGVAPCKEKYVMSNLQNSVPTPSPYAAAINTIDAFIRTLRHQCNASHLLAAVDQWLALQTVLADAARSLATGQLPPEPLRSNYRARLQTLAFELHRQQSLVQQEHSRLSHKLDHSTARREWLETLSATQ